jgi:hypothetical protein
MQTSTGFVTTYPVTITVELTFDEYVALGRRNETTVHAQDVLDEAGNYLMHVCRAAAAQAALVRLTHFRTEGETEQ